MKRTALRIETQEYEADYQQHVDEEHWALDVPELKQKESEYIVEPSTACCENLTFGRMAFKGFNPEIEKLMKSHQTEKELALAEAREKEIGVSDTEMAERYNSLVGSIGQKFSRKRKRREILTSDSSDSEDSTALAEIKAGVSQGLSQLRKQTECDSDLVNTQSKRATPQRKGELVQFSSNELTDGEIASGVHSGGLEVCVASAGVVVGAAVELNQVEGSEAEKLSAEKLSQRGDQHVSHNASAPQNTVPSSPVSVKVKGNSAVLKYYNRKKSKAGFKKPADD